MPLFSWVMVERFIPYARIERPAQAETAAGARVRLADRFPKTALRRMTHLGLLVGAALDGVKLSGDDAIVYASTFAETRALEDFLLSFPAASPLLFQTSIHPSAVQQVLIGRQQPLARFWPVTGRLRLLESALLTAMLEPAPRVVFTAGEERGTWLLEQCMAADATFALAAVLATGASGATGRIRFEPDATAPDAPCPGLSAFADAIESRRALGWTGAGGAWRLEWL